jgi:hypothetical protein
MKENKKEKGLNPQKLKNKGGRPLITLSTKQINEIEELAAYWTCEQIADHFNISHDTFARIRERQPAVLRSYKKGRDEVTKKVVKSLLQKIEEGDTTATIFWLKTREKWSENKNYLKGKISLSKDKSPLEIIDSLLEGIEKGNLTIQEATQIASLANLKANIMADISANDDHVIRTREQNIELLKELEKVIEEKKKETDSDKRSGN